ncbi:MAG: hypothetical protein R3F65_33710 [bacterium]
MREVDDKPMGRRQVRKGVALMAAGAAVAFGAAALLTGGDEGEQDDEPREPLRSRRPPAPAPAPSPAPADVYDDHRELYTPVAGLPYGPYHRTRRPPGLPLFVATAAGGGKRVVVDGLVEGEARAKAASAFQKQFKATPSSVSVRPVRRASARGAAVEHVAAQAERRGHGQAFVDTMVHLAKTEGEGGTFAVPARNFKAPCTSTALNRRRLCTTVDAPRNSGPGVITAWGVFQWNRDAGRQLHTLDNLGLRAPAIHPDWMPWDWTAAEEIAIPINYYAQLWALVRRRGRTVLDAARGVRLWHTGPSRFRRYLARGANPRAWAAVQTRVSETIDNHLKHAGVA